MTDIIQPIINNNGTSRQSMVDYRIAIGDALRDTMVAMQEIKPNGRDYIGHLDEYLRDREIYDARYRALDAIYNDVMEEALHIKNY
jgi:hypothetical protein